VAMDYKQAGVDVEAGDSLVDWLKATNPKWPNQHLQVEGIGGFAALFRADFKNYKKPCLVSCTDGVGTKIKLAAKAQSYQSVGQDLVAMCANDLICTGGVPLFFLDYYACGKLNLHQAKEFLTGVRDACLKSEMSLIGGETAEMPGVYEGADFDCAGFSIGVVDEEETLGAHRVNVGDRLIGVASSGFHSNGYSLLRKLFAEDLDQWMDELLKPTALYPSLMKKAMKIGGVHAAAHITGGGLDNITRVLPDGVVARIQSWSVPAPFLEVKSRSKMAWLDLLKTLNCGIGFVLICSQEKFEELMRELPSEGHFLMDLGVIEKANDSKAEAAWVLNDLAWEGYNG
jgi:phosphoribosylformylglycinamidine cyclo-ligase